MTTTEPTLAQRFIAERFAAGRYHEAEAQIATRNGTTPFEGHLETLTNERTGAVYFRIKGVGIELTAKVDDRVKLEQMALSLLSIARSKGRASSDA